MAEREQSIGALWAKQKGGNDFMTGKITIDGVEHGIVVFSNSKRPGKLDPDWRIFKSRPKAEQSTEPPF